MNRQLFDPGLQPERTELAWRRTVLAIGVGYLIVLRVLRPLSPGAGSAWLALGLAWVTFAVVLWSRARARHIHITRALLAIRPVAMPDARMLLGLTCSVLVCGALSAASVAMMHVH